MGTRREGRQAALQLIYQVDAARRFDDVEQAISEHFDNLAPETDQDTRAFATELCSGVAARLDEIDALLELASKNWRLERMSQVDRNVLRLATYELLSDPSVPPKAVINEAIELGKAFGSAESAAFINGVLDRVLKETSSSDR